LPWLNGLAEKADAAVKADVAVREVEVVDSVVATVNEAPMGSAVVLPYIP